jgi:hypothetical protein
MRKNGSGAVVGDVTGLGVGAAGGVGAVVWMTPGWNGVAVGGSGVLEGAGSRPLARQPEASSASPKSFIKLRRLRWGRGVLSMVGDYLN